MKYYMNPVRDRSPRDDRRTPTQYMKTKSIFNRKFNLRTQVVYTSVLTLTG